MKKSISTRLFFFSISLVAIIIIVSIFAIAIFSENIYYNKKINFLDDYSKRIEENINNYDEQEFQSLISDMTWEIGGRIYLFDENQNLYFFSEKQGFQRGRGNEAGFGTGVASVDLNNLGKIVNKTMGSGKEVLNYQTLLSNGYYLLIEMPVQDIGNTLEVVYDIFLYVFFLSLAIALIGSIIVSKYFTDPIKKLTIIAEKMGNLDFSQEYIENRSDEIGVLGKSLNILSRKLRYNIEKLSEELRKEKNMDKLRSQFVGQVSHELQTPLTIISGYVEALEDGMVENENEVAEYYKIIGDEINSMSRMIKELLELSQLKAGKFLIKKEKYVLNESIINIGLKFAMLAEKNNITFVFEKPNENFYVYADKTRIEQVLNNILNNGFKHVFEMGTIKLTMDADTENLTIAVFNEGKHIPEAEMPYIWDSFYKVERNNEKKGTGLGLAINREILNLHGFDYGVRNLNGGVEFYFTMKNVV